MLTLLLPLLLIVGGHHWTEQVLFEGLVVSVQDGDTFGVMRDGREVRVRMHGIDAPESGQPFGAAARQRLSDVIFGDTVRVHVWETDLYGRLVADVYEESVHLNVLLVREGLAWWYTEYAPGDVVLLETEQAARIARAGLWSEPEPVAPWDWRAGQRTMQPVTPRPVPVTPPPSRNCCRTCTTGRACGDSCIAANRTCRQPPGCACNG